MAKDSFDGFLPSEGVLVGTISWLRLVSSITSAPGGHHKCYGVGIRRSYKDGRQVHHACATPQNFLYLRTRTCYVAVAAHHDEYIHTAHKAAIQGQDRSTIVAGDSTVDDIPTAGGGDPVEPSLLSTTFLETWPESRQYR